MDVNTNTVHEARWLTLRRRIGIVGGPVRLRLLGLFADDVRAKGAVIAQTRAEQGEIVGYMDAAAILGVIFGAWLALEPTNPAWPGRDRVFVTCREDLLHCCAALSALGFFRVEEVDGFLSRLERDGGNAVIPGIEAPGARQEDIPDLIWESAVESARSKRRWREAMGKDGDTSWAEPRWRDSPAAWRTSAVVNAADPVADMCRVLPARGGEAVAGLAVFVKTPRVDAPDLEERWRDAGWEAAVVNRSDSLGAYDCLAAATMDKPFALILATGRGASARVSARLQVRSGEPELLGEMSDEQFGAIMGESLNF